MLRVREVDVGGDFGEKEFLQYLRGWTEEGDGSVGSALVFWFTWFGKGNDYCVFPDGWEFSVSVGEVEEPAKVLQA